MTATYFLLAERILASFRQEQAQKLLGSKELGKKNTEEYYFIERF